MESESAPRQFQEIDMSKATWADIGLRAGPGARNVFCHQGCCEHLMVIKDVRRVHPDDPQHLSAYPLIIQEVNCSDLSWPSNNTLVHLSNVPISSMVCIARSHLASIAHVFLNSPCLSLCTCLP